MSKSKLSVQSYIDSDIAQFRPDGDHPPKSARVVVSLDCGSGPGGGDYRTYLICTDRRRRGWKLWEMGEDYETGRKMYCEIAWGEPYRNCTAVEAAKILLEAAWRDEARMRSVRGFTVTDPGLLAAEDVQAIIDQVDECHDPL